MDRRHADDRGARDPGRAGRRRRSRCWSRSRSARGSTAAPTGTCATCTARTWSTRAFTVQFAPTLVDELRRALHQGVAKIVGVSDDHDAVARAAAAARRALRRPRLGLALAALLPRRDPPAGEQGLRRALARRALRHPRPRRSRRSATCPTTSLMFAHSGLSIAMGNADREVQRAARRVTASNEEDGLRQGRRAVHPRRALTPLPELAPGRARRATATPERLGPRSPTCRGVPIRRLGGAVSRGLDKCLALWI